MAEFKIGYKKELEASKKKREEAKEAERRRKFTLGRETSERDYMKNEEVDLKTEEEMVDFLTGTPNREKFYKGGGGDPSQSTEPVVIEEEKVNATKPLKENIEAAAKIAIKKGKLEPSLEDIEPSTQDKPETGSMSDSLKDALMYLGPRLGGLLIGGYEGYQEADKLATGFQKYQAGQKGLKGESRSTKYQQLQNLRDKFGRPLSFDSKTGAPRDVDGNPYFGPFIDPITGRQTTRIDFKREQARELSGEQTKRFEGLLESKKTLNYIGTLIKDVDIGQIASRKQSIQAFFGKAPDTFKELDSAIALLHQSYRKITTGAQASQQELDALFASLPSITDYMPTFISKMKAYNEMIRIKGEAFTESVKLGQPLKRETIKEITAILNKNMEKDIESPDGKRALAQDQAPLPDNMMEIANKYKLE